MLLRISLIFAILAGIGTIVVTQIKTREHIKGIIAEREQHKAEEAKERAGRKKAETDLAKTRGTLATTSNTLVQTENELNSTKQQLQAAQDGIAKVQTQLKAATEAKNAAQQELAKWDQLGVKPEQVKDMIAKVKNQEDAIAALGDEKKILQRRAAELENRIRILVGENYEVPLPAGTKGNIVAVDPKWNFVVLDLGANKGMLEGGVLMVHRHSQLVGKVRINEVQPTRSIATVLPGWKLGDVEEGDQVLY